MIKFIIIQHGNAKSVLELIKFGEFIAELYEKADLHLAHIGECSAT